MKISQDSEDKKYKCLRKRDDRVNVREIARYKRNGDELNYKINEDFL